jgi:hypothetical protein
VTKKLILAGFLLAVPLGAAQAMDVASFLKKADALEKKGLLALASSDYKLLKAEIVTASGALRTERIAAERAGRRGAYCPPGKSGLNSKEILAYLRTVPVPQRPRVEVKDALRGLLSHKFPCRG